MEAVDNVQNTMPSRPKTWLELKHIVDKSRHIAYALNSSPPVNIRFRDLPKEANNECRIYFLSGTARRETTIKHVDVPYNQKSGVLEERLLFSTSDHETSAQMLTKEEQLLRERTRCSFNGIMSFVVDDETASGRLVFSERSGLYYFDDNNRANGPVEIETSARGPIDIKLCPYDKDIMSYVINGDLWVKHLQTGHEVRLTYSENFCTAGVASYILQEEFDRYTGYWWQPQTPSATCHRIVYEVVDDRDVDVIYVTPSCVNDFNYDTYKYPKAGTNNSKVCLRLVEFVVADDGQVVPSSIQHRPMLHSFSDLFSWFEYLIRADWTPNGQHFWVQLMDRLQGHMVDVLLPVEFFSTGVNLDSRNHLPVLIHEQKSTIWINTNNTMYFIRHEQPSANTITKDFAFVKASSESKYLHLYKHVVSLADMVEPVDESNGLVRRARVIKRTQLTAGDWCVEWKENVCVDEPNNLIYFVGYRNPLESQLFVVDMRFPMRIKQLTPDNYSHTINMNKTCTLFVAVSTNLTTPGTVAVYQIINQKLGLDKLNASEIARILNPDSVQSPVASLSVLYDDVQRTLLTQPEIFSFQTSDNANLYGLIYKPCNYKPNVKYPTVLHVYGGPRVQLVSNAYKANRYRLHMLSLLGYCVVVVDSRGSDYRGVEFESHLRHRMGAVEIDDQVQGLTYAANKYECIDMSRVAIFGWSYGGYMSLMGLCQRPDVFKLAIAGAPVTTWELYDTGYTERYMGLPCTNTEGYQSGSVLNRAKSFPNDENRLLIMHGMIDENVHFIHTRKLISALIRENKPYTLQVYPNERHGIRSTDASIHCDLNLFSFLEQNI